MIKKMLHSKDFQSISLPFMLLLLVFNVKSQNNFYQTFNLSHFQESHSIQPTSDNGFLVSGYVDIGYYTYTLLLKADENGDMEWYKTYFKNESYGLSNISYPTNDGGFIVGPSYFKYGAMDTSEFMLMKTDGLGNVEWEKHFNYQDDQCKGGSFIKTSDNGYIICGHRINNDIRTPLLVKTDSNGIEKWKKNFPEFVDAAALSIFECSDGGYLTGGAIIEDGELKYLLFKVNSRGDLLFYKTYFWNDNFMFMSAVEIESGGYYFCGINGIKLPTSAYLVKVNEQADSVFSVSFGTEKGGNFKKIIPANDGGFVLVGKIVGGDNYGLILIVKVDDDGELVWEREIPFGEADAYAENIVAIDDGYLICGGLWDYNNGTYEILTIKVNNQGLMTDNLSPEIETEKLDTAFVNIEYNQQIIVTDPDEDELTINVSGLPEGLLFQPDNNTISGTPLEKGNYTVVITVDDGNEGMDEKKLELVVAEPNNVFNITQDDLSIYPNPSAGEFYVNRSDVNEVYIYGLTGKLVYSRVNYDNSVLSIKEQGTYIVKTITDKEIFYSKILIKN